MAEGKLSLLQKIAAVRDSAKFYKDSKIQTKDGPYDIWTETAVLAVIRPLFTEYGLVALRESIEVAFNSPTGCRVVVNMRIYDIESGESLAFSGIGTGLDKADKDSGKASTYATKDAYLKLFMAVSGMDPDTMGSDVQDESLRAECKALLKKAWDVGMIHAKAAQTIGKDKVDVNDSDTTAEANRIFAKKEREIQEKPMKEVLDIFNNMSAILERYK